MAYWDELWPLVLSIGFLAGVIGNLTASLLWALPAFIHLHRKLNRQHDARMQQAERHHRALVTAISGNPEEGS
jgi:hypothetical protein